MQVRHCLILEPNLILDYLRKLNFDVAVIESIVSAVFKQAGLYIFKIL